MYVIGIIYLVYIVTVEHYEINWNSKISTSMSLAACPHVYYNNNIRGVFSAKYVSKYTHRILFFFHHFHIGNDRFAGYCIGLIANTCGYTYIILYCIMFFVFVQKINLIYIYITHFVCPWREYYIYTIYYVHSKCWCTIQINNNLELS